MQDPKSGLLPDGSALAPEFASRAAEVARACGIPYAWLVAVMGFETAWKFRSDTKNPGSSATGLIQFMSATARKMGTTTEHLRSLSAVDQLEWVRRYFEPFGSFASRAPEDVYLAVFAPALMGKPEGASVYVSPSAAYTANKHMDADGDGYITKAEILGKIRSAHAKVVRLGWDTPPKAEGEQGSPSHWGSAGSRGCS